MTGVRRLTGVGLLVGVVVCALVVSGVQGVRVAGIPSAPPGLREPSVGDCLLTVSDSAGLVPHPGRPVLQPVSGVSQDAAIFGRCSPAGQLGEVVGYQQYPSQSVAAGADIAWCQQVSEDYRGHQQWRYKEAAGGLWEPLTGQRFLTVQGRPSADQQEPRWAACVLLAPNLEIYTGSFLRSLAEDPAPSPFGVCMDGGETQRWVSCDIGHRTQEFGTGTGQPMTARDAVAACQTLISRMTGMPDITASGLLRVEVIGGWPDGTGAADDGGTSQPDRPIGGSAGPGSCRLSILGEQRLFGTLIGIGSGTLPVR
ncbi:MAG: hypothetical protein ABWZ98_00815 [Nakamurella sp.]